MQRLLDDAARRASAYLSTLDARPVFPGEAALTALSRFDEPLPAGPTDDAEVLRVAEDVRRRPVGLGA